MITEHDLREAIAECEGVKNPNANTCVKLAAFYSILDRMHQAEQPVVARSENLYSFSAGDLPYSESEFSQATERKGMDKVFPIIDELMDALMILNPGLYKSVIRKISDL